MKKQTAVEWYEKEINSLFEKYEEKQISRADFLVMKHNIFYPAKEMEKEQIIRARQDGLDNGFSNGSWDSNLYYNETYGDK